MLSLSGAEVRQKLTAQIEYYFSDFMLPASDRRLAAAIASDSNGWVPLEALMAYPRVLELGSQLRDFGPAVLAEALEASALLQLNRAGSAVRRRYPYGEQGKDFVPLDDEERRVYACPCSEREIFAAAVPAD